MFPITEGFSLLSCFRELFSKIELNYSKLNIKYNIDNNATRNSARLYKIHSTVQNLLSVNAYIVHDKPQFLAALEHKG